MLSWAVSSVFPIFASYRAYENYHTLATKSGATTVNVGGVNIPLGTMLRRATSAPDQSIEEDTLNSRLLAVQMWLIYWVVAGCVSVVESIVPLHVLPLYSVARLCFSVWLIAPIVLNSATLQKKLLVSHQEMQAEWAAFSQQGCGLVYFSYVKPLMQGQLSFLYDLKVDQIVALLSRYLMGPLLQLAGIASRNASAGPSAGPSASATAEPPQYGSSAPGDGVNYMQTFSTFSKTYFPSRAVDGDGARAREGTPSSAEELAEYDVVDTPAMTASVAGLKNRREPGEARGWFW